LRDSTETASIFCSTQQLGHFNAKSQQGRMLYSITDDNVTNTQKTGEISAATFQRIVPSYEIVLVVQPESQIA
jgi:hypothetical protein